MTVECPHGNTPGERCAQCVAAGRRQPGDHNARRYTDPDRVDKQTKADDALTRQAQRQEDERTRVRVARAAAAWSRTQQQLSIEGDG